MERKHNEHVHIVPTGFAWTSTAVMIQSVFSSWSKTFWKSQRTNELTFRLFVFCAGFFNCCTQNPLLLWLWTWTVLGCFDVTRCRGLHFHSSLSCGLGMMMSLLADFPPHLRGCVDEACVWVRVCDVQNENGTREVPFFIGLVLRHSPSGSVLF